MERLRTDKASEFFSAHTKKILNDRGKHYFTITNDTKANYAERAIKTIKFKIARYFAKNQTHRWIDLLQDIVKAYNETPHRTIGISPAQAQKSFNAFLWDKQYAARESNKNLIKRSSKDIFYKKTVSTPIRSTLDE
jgi:hypothetical protein